MKKSAKLVFFIIAIFIVALVYTAIFGVYGQYGDIKLTYVKGANDIRWGIDIRGGVDVTFTPPEGVVATSEQMDAATSVIQQRLVAQNITDNEVYTDAGNQRIIVRFPWREGETDFDPEEAIKELGATAVLTFRKGTSADGELVLEGKDIESATAMYNQQTMEYFVSLKLYEEGKESFATVTTELAGTSTPISIWMDNEIISSPYVNEAITNGEAMISGNTSNPFTADSASSLANKINAGALPFQLVTENFSSISPTIGENAKNVMVMAGLIAFAAIALFMILIYRLPGCIAMIALAGQVAATIASISGYIPTVASFTLTLPGIAGIILAIGMGVDANIITASRIKEELRSGKTVPGAISYGLKQSLSSIIDGNITIVIVGIVLLGAFGTSDSFFARLLKPIFFMFPPSTTGLVYSFGYTLLMGVIFNFIFGVLASRLMLTSISKFNGLQKPWLYGGAKHEND